MEKVCFRDPKGKMRCVTIQAKGFIYVQEFGKDHHYVCAWTTVDGKPKVVCKKQAGRIDLIGRGF